MLVVVRTKLHDLLMFERREQVEPTDGLGVLDVFRTGNELKLLQVS